MAYTGQEGSAWKGTFFRLQGPVTRKMVNFNPGLSQILGKVFLSKNMQRELKILFSLHSEIQLIITQNVTLSII